MWLVRTRPIHAAIETLGFQDFHKAVFFTELISEDLSLRTLVSGQGSPRSVLERGESQ